MRKVMAAALVAAFVAALVTPAPAFGLEFKRIAGIAWSRFSTPPNPVAIPEAGFSLRSRVTLVFGGGFVYRMTPHLSLDVSGQYLRKGTRVDNRFWATLLGTYTYDLRVLSAPVCLRYGLLRGSTPYALGGFEVSYVLAHDMTYYPVGSTSGTVNKLRPATRKIDFAAVLGGGGELVFRRLTIFAELRWYAGLVNLSKSIEGYPVIKTRALSLQVGFRTKRSPLAF